MNPEIMQKTTHPPSSLISSKCHHMDDRLHSNCSSEAHHQSKNRIWSNVIKSPLDKRDYRVFMLANELKVTVISDPEVQKSAAALSVQAGSMLDPKEFFGLAHLCEKMIFRGNKNDFNENSFENVIKKSNGEFTSFTQRDLTVFSFDICPLYFLEALAKFSRYFVSPTFPKSSIETGINLIEEEYKSRLKMEEKRQTQVSLSLTKTHHPYNQFDCGNRKSLLKNYQKLEDESRLYVELLKFYKSFYSANLMSLAILSRESCQDLQDFVQRNFISIQNFHRAVPRWSENPYGPDQLMTTIEMVPLCPNLRKLCLTFPIPDYDPHYKTGTIPYLRSLLANDGPGSLVSHLKNANWINELQVDYEHPANGFAFLTLDFELTPKGLPNVNCIINHFFQYLKMLRQEGPQRWLWEEMKLINETKFRFMTQSQEISFNFVENLVSLMPIVPPSEILSGRYLFNEFKPQLIKELFNHLQPRNMRIILSCIENENIINKVEYWYQTKYKYSPIPPDLIKQWVNCSFNIIFRLPPPNPFIATQFHLKPTDLKSVGKTPRILENTQLCQLWFLQDNEFLVAKGTIILAIMSPLPKQQVVNYNMTRLMCRIINDSLTEFTCAANMAGLSFNVEASIGGLTITVHGYSEKLHVLMNYILNKVFHFYSNGKVSCSKYHQILNDYKAELLSWKNQEPHIQGIEQIEHVLSSHSWTCDELIQHLDDKITLARLTEFSKRFFSIVKLVWFFHGNFTDTEALRIYRAGLKYFQCVNSKSLPLSFTKFLEMKEVPLSTGTTSIGVQIGPENKNSAIVILLQSDRDDEGSESRETVMMELIEIILAESALKMLTKNQSEISVWTNVRKSRGNLGYQITIQGPSHPDILEESIELFLNSMSKTISEMTQQTFLQHCIALATKKIEKIKSFWEKSVKIFQEIFEETYNFENCQQELEQLQNISLKDINHFYKEWINPSSKNRRRLCIKVTSLNSFSRSPNFTCEQIDEPKDIEKSKEIEALKKILDEDLNDEIGNCVSSTTTSFIALNSKFNVVTSDHQKSAQEVSTNFRKLVAATRSSRSCLFKVDVGDGDDVAIGNDSSRPLSLVSEELNWNNNQCRFKIYYKEIEEEIKILTDLKKFILIQLENSSENRTEKLEKHLKVVQFNCCPEYQVYTLKSIIPNLNTNANNVNPVESDYNKQKKLKNQLEANEFKDFPVQKKTKEKSSSAATNSSKISQKNLGLKEIHGKNQNEKERESLLSRERGTERKKSFEKIATGKKSKLPIKKLESFKEKENLFPKSIKKLMAGKEIKNPSVDAIMEMKEIQEIKQLDFDIRNEIKRLQNLRKLLDDKTKKIIVKDSGKKFSKNGSDQEKIKERGKGNYSRGQKPFQVVRTNVDTNNEVSEEDERLRKTVAVIKSKTKLGLLKGKSKVQQRKMSPSPSHGPGDRCIDFRMKYGTNPPEQGQGLSVYGIESRKIVHQTLTPKDKNEDDPFVPTNKDSWDGSFREQDLVRWLHRTANNKENNGSSLVTSEGAGIIVHPCDLSEDDSNGHDLGQTPRSKNSVKKKCSIRDIEKVCEAKENFINSQNSKNQKTFYSKKVTSSVLKKNSGISKNDYKFYKSVNKFTGHVNTPLRTFGRISRSSLRDRIGNTSNKIHNKESKSIQQNIWKKNFEIDKMEKVGENEDDKVDSIASGKCSSLTILSRLLNSKRCSVIFKTSKSSNDLSKNEKCWKS